MSESSDKWVYIASPYTSGDVAVNVKNQMDAFIIIRKAGWVPIAPLMCHFIHIHDPQSYDFWFDTAVEWLKKCEYLVRLPGESQGADKETQLAKEMGVFIFDGIGDFLDHIKS